MWCSADIDFDYVEFYQAMVNYLKIAPGPVAKARVADLLAWWNK